MLIKAGSVLIIPRSSKMQADVSDDIADNGQLNLQPERVTRRTTIKAGKKDTVASIARRYKVSAKEVADWNDTSPTGHFSPGQSVVVYVAVRTSSHVKHAGKTAARKQATTKKPAKTAKR